MIQFVTCTCSKLVKNFEILICPQVTQYIQIQANWKEAKRKAPYRPLERTTYKKSRVADWSTICKKKKKEKKDSEEKGAQLSISENKNHYNNEQEAGQKKA